MLSANTSSMPATQALPLLLRGSFRQRLHRHVARFFRRLFGAKRGLVAGLPDDLRADVGLDAARPERSEAFWRDRPRSVGRDLPL
ncbi:hypothetical protein GCM10010924_13070 [Rhizobium wenxiniae]|uniref:DUF1127 domain-containing protein n=1 Tax=Rhizobium wenxiniae TaxID=1737357 RepID=A0A7X0CYC8_9HYPH|nr:hypothetical protein [Rhizobium wenxiniae]MBB6161155.1 hypothetical protein [Rhizobium wenxiniae]GGF86781.1 hypothetical protein GCM10010924_13070 [Rhizobium wenxiniae]